MEIELIYCPACRHKLRIPLDWLGQPVQCPECRVTFLSPPPPPMASPTSDSPPLPVDRERLGPPEPPPPAPDAPWIAPTTIGAGFALLMVSLLGVFVSLAKILVSQSPAMMRAIARNNQFGGAIDANQFAVLGAIFTVVSFVGMLGGVAMMARRSYMLALIGSVAAVFNVCDCCTMISPPIGIACIVLLFVPQVRSTFRS